MSGSRMFAAGCHPAVVFSAAAHAAGAVAAGAGRGRRSSCVAAGAGLRHSGCRQR